MILQYKDVPIKLGMLLRHAMHDLPQIRLNFDKKAPIAGERVIKYSTFMAQLCRIKKHGKYTLRYHNNTPDKIVQLSTRHIFNEKDEPAEFYEHEYINVHLRPGEKIEAYFHTVEYTPNNDPDSIICAFQGFEHYDFNYSCPEELTFKAIRWLNRPHPYITDEFKSIASEFPDLPQIPESVKKSIEKFGKQDITKIDRHVFEHNGIWKEIPIYRCKDYDKIFEACKKYKNSNESLMILETHNPNIIKEARDEVVRKFEKLLEDLEPMMKNYQLVPAFIYYLNDFCKSDIIPNKGNVKVEDVSEAKSVLSKIIKDIKNMKF